MSGFDHTNKYFRAQSSSRSSLDPLLLLAHRLRLVGAPADTWSFPNIEHVHVWVNPTTAFVLVIKNGTSNVLQEDANVFPSDGLVASFKLMMEPGP